MKTISRESNAVNSEMSAPWAETTLLTILSKRKLNDIFNADKFGLFYQCLSKKTNLLLGEICCGGKIRNIVKFPGKHLWQSFFFNKFAGLRPAALFKKRLWHRCFLVNFAKVLETPFFIEHP